MNPKLLIYHDLIGIYALAKPKSKLNNQKYSHIGIVIDETRDMLITKKENKIKKYVKEEYKFRFKIPKKNIKDQDFYLEVDGNKIVGLPINRLRSLRRKRWLKNE
ncbi:MAG: ribonuclease P protein subunit [Promethearchaeota archaeon]